MVKKVVIIDGHPDPGEDRYCHAMADAYARGAAGGGHEIRRIMLAKADLPFLRSKRDWEAGTPSEFIHDCQDAIRWAEHLVIIYPLWLGSMPALLKAFFEQTLRPGFAIAEGQRSLRPGLLRGKSARIVVTMGMPAFVYRLYFRAHSLKSLERNILRFSGIGPIRRTLIGGVETIGTTRRESWLRHIGDLGQKAI